MCTESSEVVDPHPADIRQACAIHSATHGSILNVPREDRLNRLYVQLNEEGSSFDRTQITPKVMLEAARRIMAPYELDFKYCDWWSVYQVSGTEEEIGCFRSDFSRLDNGWLLNLASKKGIHFFLLVVA